MAFLQKFSIFFLFFTFLYPIHGRIHNLHITNDPRFVFSIESFGFLAGGKVNLDIRNVQVTPPNMPHTLGFIIYPTSNEGTVNSNVNMLERDRICALDVAPSTALIINVSDPSLWTMYSIPAEVTGAAMYDLLFTHCSPISGITPGVSGSVTVSFDLDAAFVNPGDNYLSAGDMPLPAIYGTMCSFFFIVSIIWARYLRKNKGNGSVYKIHHLMTVLVAVKCIQLLMESVMYSYIARTGHNSAWNVMFYIFTLLKTFIMIVVTLLVATGWSIMRPFLSQREKKVLLVAVSLQLLANTAIIITDELAPGSLTYVEWTDIFHITDILASIAIIIPIHWSKRSLEAMQSSSAVNDDSDSNKRQETLLRLRALQKFYMMTIGYVYVTRLLLWLLSQGLPFDMTWVSPATEEIATLAYYVATGWYFRPHSENAYLRVSQDDDDDDVATARATGAAAGTIEGSAPTVQTIEMTKRNTNIANDSKDADEWDNDNTKNTTKSSSSTANGNKPTTSSIVTMGGKRVGTAHAIGDEYDDDEDFGLDDIGDEETGDVKHSSNNHNDEDDDIALMKAAGIVKSTEVTNNKKSTGNTLKQVKKG